MDFPAPVNEDDRKRYYAYVDEHLDSYIARLAEAVAIPSVSADGARRPDCVRMVHHYQSMMEKLGVTTELRDLGQQPGAEIDLPPVILGRYKEVDPAKRTVCAYGHLDVQPAEMADGWATEPFVLTRVESTPEVYS